MPSGAYTHESVIMDIQIRWAKSSL